MTTLNDDISNAMALFLHLGVLIVAASMNGFGIMEGQIGARLVPDGNLEAATAALAGKAAGWIKAERSGFGDW